MRDSFIINKYIIGDVYWCNIEGLIQDHIIDNRSKFHVVTILVKCKLNNEDINIPIDGHKSMVMNGGRVPL